MPAAESLYEMSDPARAAPQHQDARKERAVYPGTAARAPTRCLDMNRRARSGAGPPAGFVGKVAGGLPALAPRPGLPRRRPAAGGRRRSDHRLPMFENAGFFLPITIDREPGAGFGPLKRSRSIRESSGRCEDAGAGG